MPKIESLEELKEGDRLRVTVDGTYATVRHSIRYDKNISDSAWMAVPVFREAIKAGNVELLERKINYIEGELYMEPGGFEPVMCIRENPLRFHIFGSGYDFPLSHWQKGLVPIKTEILPQKDW